MPSAKATGVSVVIPTHNRAQFLPQTLGNILAQKKADWQMEVIVVDDGSTDNTREVLAPFLKKIIYIPTPGSGRPAVPRNIGIHRASYELIAFQDSDDLWSTEKFETQLKAFEDPEVILAYGNAEFMNESGQRSGQAVLKSGQGKSGSVFSDLIKENFISTLTVVARKSALESVGLFNESMGLRGVEDYELWLRLAAYGKFAYIDKVLAYYRQHPGNISGISESEAHLRLIEVFHGILDSPLEKSQRHLVLERLTWLYSALHKMRPHQVVFILQHVRYRLLLKSSRLMG